MTNTAENNPLIGIRFQIPFDRIRPKHVEPAISELLDESRRGL